ncbi:MAG: hypothetical protein ACSLFR_05195, partial [Solirubrobacteraceae bacterium]
SSQRRRHRPPASRSSTQEPGMRNQQVRDAIRRSPRADPTWAHLAGEPDSDLARRHRLATEVIRTSELLPRLKQLDVRRSTDPQGPHFSLSRVKPDDRAEAEEILDLLAELEGRNVWHRTRGGPQVLIRNDALAAHARHCARELFEHALDRARPWMKDCVDMDRAAAHLVGAAVDIDLFGGAETYWLVGN